MSHSHRVTIFIIIIIRAFKLSVIKIWSRKSHFRVVLSLVAVVAVVFVVVVVVVVVVVTAVAAATVGKRSEYYKEGKGIDCALVAVDKYLQLPRSRDNSFVDSPGIGTESVRQKMSRRVG